MTRVLEPAPRVEIPSELPVSSRRATRAVPLLTIVAEASMSVSVGIAARYVDDASLRSVVGASVVLFLGGRVIAGTLRGRRAALTLFLFGVVRVGVFAPAIFHSGTLRSLAALFALAGIPMVAGLLPELALNDLVAGQRDPLVPSLFAAAGAAAVGVIGAIALSGAVDRGNAQVAGVVAYVATATALLAIAQLLADHHASSGFAGSAAVLTSVAIGVQLALLGAGLGAATDDAATALFGAATTVLVGLLVATVLSTPRPMVVDDAEAGDGPRFVGWALLVLVVVAVATRLPALRAVWVDDATVARTVARPWADMLRVARNAPAPPISNVVGFASNAVFGSSVIALRLPALLAGVLLVPVLYLAGTALYGRRVGIFAAAIAAFAPGVVWLSATAQSGAIAALLAAASLTAMLYAIRRRRARYWVLFGVSCAALVWAHEFGFVHVAVLHAAVAVVVRRCVREGQLPRGLVAGWAFALAASVVSFVAVIVFHHGIGPAAVPPPLEYATPGSPGAGQSLLGLASTGLAALFGFHPADVTSRLLALWPLCMLAAFFVFWRRWSFRGALVGTLALAPFAVLVVAQLAGAPRRPPFALTWVVTAVPMIVLGVARVASVATARWPRARLVAFGIVAILSIALVDQTIRVRPVARFDVAAASRAVARDVRPGDVIVFAPDAIGDVVRFYAGRGVDVVPVPADVRGRLAAARRIYVIGMFAFDTGASSNRTVDLVRKLAAHRSLLAERRRDQTDVWVFQ